MAEPQPASPEQIAKRDPDLRADLDGGLRFTHKLIAAARRDVYETAWTVLALIEEMSGRGLVDDQAYARRLGEVQDRELKRIENHARVHLEQSVDKYVLGSPGIPCDELIPLCRGRCCTLHFPLSKQDLGERVVKWDYLRPYIIRQRDSDGYCVHNDPTSKGCTVYHNRPAVCRSYDCRNDKRIWLDYDKRIPAVDPHLTPREAPVPAGPPPEKPWPFTD